MTKSDDPKTYNVFAFEYCYCRFESGFSVISLHGTKAAAYRAMMKHKNSHWYTERAEGRDATEIGWMSLWRIRELTVHC